MLRVRFSGKHGKGFSALEAVANEGDCGRPFAPLGQWVALLAMKYSRAPLPVSRSLERALMRQGFPVDPAELGDLARRYLFLGDAQMLLAESRKRPVPILNSLELVKQLNTETQTPLENGAQYQCP